MRKPDNIIRTVAAGLRDVINETLESHLAKDSESTFTDLAHRLVLRLLREAIVIAPEHHSASTRVFDVLTGWMGMHPDCSCVTRIDLPTGKFELTVRGPDGLTIAFFRGGSIQDAYAQAAQVIALDGSLS